MKRLQIPRIVLTVSAMIVFTISAVAEVPSIINYQGRLTDDAGQPVTVSKLMKFKIYGSDTGDDSLWSSGFQVVELSNGLFEYGLGSHVPLPAELFTEDGVRYLGMTIDVNPESQPRIQLVCTPYTYRAHFADSSNTISGDAITSGKIKDGTIQPVDLSFIPATRPIVNPQIGPGEIAGDAIRSDHIFNGTILIEDLSFTPATRPLNPGIEASEISNDAVTSDKIQDGTIQSEDLSFTPATRPLSPGITTAEISNNAVNSDKIMDNSIAFNDIAQNGATSGQTIKWNGSQWTAANDSVGSFDPPPTAGIASTHTSVATTLNSDTMTDIATVTITTPDDGFIFVQGRCRITFDNGSTVLPISAYLQIDETAGGTETASYYIMAGLTGTQNLGYADYIPVYVDRVYQKPAGAYTFRLEGRGGGIDPSSVVRAGSQSVTAIYIPIAMGAVSGSKTSGNNGN